MCVTILTAVAGWSLKDLRINPDVVSYFPANDPAVELFRQVGEEYGGTLLAIAALRTDEIFTERTLRHIAALTDTFRTIEGVRSVTSLTNILDIRESDLGVEITKLIDQYNLPDTPEELLAIKQYALGKDMIRGRILSKDSRTTLIVARLAQDADEVKTAARLRAAVRTRELPEQTWFAGFPFQMLQISEMVVRDLQTLVPISALVVIAALFVSFRTLHGVLMPLITVLIGSVWTLGLMAALGAPVTIVSNVIPVILIAVGSAYGIHVVNRYREWRDFPDSPDEHAAETLREIGPAVLLAGFTTIIGFLSFIFGSYLLIIRDFGLFSSLGIGLVCIIALTLIPALLRLWSPGQSHVGSGDAADAVHDSHRILDRIAVFACTRRCTVLLTGLALCALAATGIPRITRKAAILDYFSAGTPIRQAERILSNEFGGSIPLQILVHGDVQEPAVLKAMERTATFLDSLPGVHNVQSVADLIEEMNEVMGDGKSIPDSRAKVVNLWFLLEGESVMEQLVNDDYRQGVIRATITDVHTQRTRYLVRTIEEYLQKHNTRGCTMEQTGLHLIYRNLDQSIVRTLYQSLIIAFLLIFGCMLFLLRSPATALRGMISIGFTLLIVFGVMGWVGLPLDIVTVLIGSVSIGIGIDYSIHFAGRYRTELQSRDNRGALRKTMATTGRAIAVNMFTVAAGFLVLCFAELIPLRQFGALVALTMVASATGALTLLPAALAAPKRKESHH